MLKLPGFYILKNKKPVLCKSTTEWAVWFDNPDNRRIRHDYVGKILISTVFLGIDPGYNGGPPVLFETMVFGGKHNQAQQRYHTYEQAIKGHEAWLAKVKSSKKG